MQGRIATIGLLVVSMVCTVKGALWPYGTATPVPGLEGLDMLASDITEGGQRMLLTIWSGSARLHETTWDPIGETWTTPQDMGFDNWDGYASLSPDQQAMYYDNHGTIYVDLNGDPADDVATTLPGGIPHGISLSEKYAFFAQTTNKDIYSADYDPQTPADFANPQKVIEISTQWTEYTPYITDDNLNLLFASDRPGGYGGLDIWEASWDGEHWSDIINLGVGVNTPHDEYLPFYSVDTAMLYFSRATTGPLEPSVLMQTEVIPEPSTFLLLGLGAVMVRRKR